MVFIRFVGNRLTRMFGLKESKANLVTLHLGQNSITEAGAVALASFLTENKSLEELNMNMNDIGNGGMYKVMTPPPWAWTHPCETHWRRLADKLQVVIV